MTRLCEDYVILYYIIDGMNHVMVVCSQFSTFQGY